MHQGNIAEVFRGGIKIFPTWWYWGIFDWMMFTQNTNTNQTNKQKIVEVKIEKNQLEI